MNLIKSWIIEYKILNIGPNFYDTLKQKKSRSQIRKPMIAKRKSIR